MARIWQSPQHNWSVIASVFNCQHWACFRAPISCVSRHCNQLYLVSHLMTTHVYVALPRVAPHSQAMLNCPNHRLPISASLSWNTCNAVEKLRLRPTSKIKTQWQIALIFFRICHCCKNTKDDSDSLTSQFSTDGIYDVFSMRVLKCPSVL